MSLDTETHDPNLLDKGPGFIRSDAEIKGFSVATDDKSWYFPLTHPEGNYHDPQAAIDWIRDLAKVENTEWLFHNALYDVESMDSIDVCFEGPWADTMVNESLIDENQKSFSLDATANRRINRTKNETLLKEAAAAYSVDPKGGLHLLPSGYVGPYAEDDAGILHSIRAVQRSILEEEDLLGVLDLESRLLKVIWAMRKQGVAINLEKAFELGKQWQLNLDDHLHSIFKLSNMHIDIWSPESLVLLCGKFKVTHNLTPTGKPSFENTWLSEHMHPVFNHVARARKYDKMKRDFIDVYLRDNINGRIHAQFHTTRRDDYGTRSGRFSSSNPNLQQVPARDPEFGPAIRSLFMPDDGAEWGKFDYSSQEPRIALHFAHIAGVRGAISFIERYRSNPYFCQHDYANEILRIPRRDAKDINLGITYGMGLAKQALRMGKSMADIKIMRYRYNQALPFVKGVADKYTKDAERMGYTTTVLGRRSRFPNTSLAYKALNRAVQGSGADMIKMSMVTLFEEEGIVPLLTVHDETGNNIYEPEHVEMITEHMEHAIELTVPMVVEPELGPNWGELK